MDKRPYFLLLLIAGIALLSTACGGLSPSTTINPAFTVSFTPDFVPVTFSVNSNGDIGLNAGSNLPTPIGDIQLTGGVTTSPPPQVPPAALPAPPNELLLTIRHQLNGTIVDSSYSVLPGQNVGSVKVQGNISQVQVGWTGTSNSVFIDASNGNANIVVQGGLTTNTVSPNTAQGPTTSGCPGADTVAQSMNLPQGSVQQSSGQSCSFSWTGVDNSNAQCSTGYGPSTVTITSQDSSDAETVACDGVEGSELDVSSGDTVAITFGSSNSNATPEPSDATPEPTETDTGSN